jgi:hypothetical protein
MPSGCRSSARALTSPAVLPIGCHTLLCPSVDGFQEFVGSAPLHCLPSLLAPSGLENSSLLGCI